MLSDYAVDVWFLYGSFSYGLESSVCAFSSHSLTLDVVLEGSDAAEDVSSFLETLVENPRGLVRSELCLYPPMAQDPIRLYTEVSPALTPSSGGVSVRLRFSHLAALTPHDNNAWQHLVTDVWPGLLPGGSSNSGRGLF